MTPDTAHDPLDGLADAFADTFPERPDDRRCYDFLMREWLDQTDAVRAAYLIGEFNFFEPHLVETAIFNIIVLDPDARFLFGREIFPVLYVETTQPFEVEDILRRDATTSTAQTMSHGDVLGKARQYPDDAHGACEHDEPPVPVDEWPTRQRPRAISYVHAEWA